MRDKKADTPLRDHERANIADMVRQGETSHRTSQQAYMIRINGESISGEVYTTEKGRFSTKAIKKTFKTTRKDLGITD